MNNNVKQKLESPCVRNCCLDEQDICLGCFRSVTEITQWALASDQTRRVFLKNIALRRTQRNSNHSKSVHILSPSPKGECRDEGK